MGGSCVYKHAGHINITIVQDILPPTGKKALRLVVQVLCCILFSIMIYCGFVYVGKQGAQLSPAMRLPMSYMYASIAVGGILMLIHGVDAVLQLVFVREANHSALVGEEAQS